MRQNLISSKRLFFFTSRYLWSLRQKLISIMWPFFIRFLWLLRESTQKKLPLNLPTIGLKKLTINREIWILLGRIRSINFPNNLKRSLQLQAFLKKAMSLAFISNVFQSTIRSFFQLLYYPPSKFSKWIIKPLPKKRQTILDLSLCCTLRRFIPVRSGGFATIASDW